MGEAKKATPLPLTWTKTPPTEPGIYLRVFNVAGGAHPVWGGPQTVFLYNRASDRSEQAYFAMCYPCARWYGPIPAPLSPPQEASESEEPPHV